MSYYFDYPWFDPDYWLEAPTPVPTPPSPIAPLSGYQGTSLCFMRLCAATFCRSKPTATPVVKERLLKPIIWIPSRDGDY